MKIWNIYLHQPYSTYDFCKRGTILWMTQRRHIEALSRPLSYLYVKWTTTHLPDFYFTFLSWPSGQEYVWELVAIHSLWFPHLPDLVCINELKKKGCLTIVVVCIKIKKNVYLNWKIVILSNLKTEACILSQLANSSLRTNIFNLNRYFIYRY